MGERNGPVVDRLSYYPRKLQPDNRPACADGGRCVPGSNIINSPPGKSAKKEE